MNRIFLMGVSVLAILLTFGGCGMSDMSDNRVESTENPGNSVVEEIVTEAAEMGKDMKEMVTGDEADIGMDKAKEIALKDAGKGEDDVTFVRTEQKREDGKLLHVIEFRDDREEYYYEIDASDGSIHAGKNDNN